MSETAPILAIDLPERLDLFRADMKDEYLQEHHTLKFLPGFIDNDIERLEPLADSRHWLQAYSRNFDNRMSERRNGQEGIGPFTPECRQEIRDRLLAVQRKAGSALVSEADIARIKAADWNC